MSVAPGRLRMSEEEFVTWCNDPVRAEFVRAEWVDGKVVEMSPVNINHTRLNQWLASLMAEFVAFHELGEVVGPEYMFRLAAQRRRRVPDILFVSTARANLLLESHLEGPPDLAVEIVSRESQSRDRREKHQEYEAAGVREYWIVDPFTETVEVYGLNGEGKFELISPGKDATEVVSAILPGFRLPLEWFWMEKRPRGKAVRVQLGIDD